MQQLAERLSPVSGASLVNSSRGITTSTIRRSDEEKVFQAESFQSVLFDLLCPLLNKCSLFQNVS